MQFTEQKATELISQHNLAPGTLNTWRKRGSIPDKYEIGIKTRITNEADLQAQANLIRAITTKKINIAALCRLAGLNSHHPLQDAIRGRANLTKEDLTALKKALNTLRIEVRKVLSELEKNRTVQELTIKAVGKLWERSELQWFVILNRNRVVYQKFEAWLIKRRGFPTEEIKFLKEGMSLFLTETSI